MRRDRLVAALDLWVIRQLAGFGMQMSVRTFKYLLIGAIVLSVPVLGAFGHAGVSLGSEILAEAGVAKNTSVADRKAMIVVPVIAATIYFAVVDLLRSCLSGVRLIVARSSMRGLWSGLDIRLYEAVAVERGLPVLIRTIAMSALLAGASAAAGPELGFGTLVSLAVMIPLGYASASLGLALVHARSGVARRSPIWVWLCLAGVSTAAGIIAARVLAGRSARAVRLQLDEQLPTIQVMLAFATVAAIGLLTSAMISSVGPAPWTRSDEQPRTESRRSVNWLARATGAADRIVVGSRVIAVTMLVALAIVGWRIGGAAELPGAEYIPRASSVYVIFMVTAITSGATTVVGQGVNLWQYRYLWEQGESSGSLYRAMMLVAGSYAVRLGVAVTVLVLAGWSYIPWRALVLIAALVCGEHLIDSAFARGDDPDDTHRQPDPVSAVAGLGLLMLALALAVWTSPLGGVALVLMTLMMGVGSRWMFDKRIRSLPLAAG